MPDLSFAEVGEILRLLQHVEACDVTLEWGDLKVHVRRVGDGASPRVAETTELSATVSPSVAAPVRAAVPSYEDASTGHASTGDTSIGDTSIGDTSIGDTSIGDTSIGDTSTGDEIPGHWVAIDAPMVGTFYRAAKPDEPVFVDVGDTVVPGDKVGLIEVMKLFTELTSDVAGKVAQISADNASLVEYGQPLLWIEPS